MKKLTRTAKKPIKPVRHEINDQLYLVNQFCKIKFTLSTYYRIRYNHEAQELVNFWITYYKTCVNEFRH